MFVLILARNIIKLPTKITARCKYGTYKSVFFLWQGHVRYHLGAIFEF